ncbi:MULTISPECIES: base excision DNA repair protein, HhH-GPD family [Acidobacterium]|uniref:Base excision DNA repair protein, HhH-GPD family n=1 Tax=Acidobacterium capsulatum (strain ATCC 51196 / DSM 11244 / BCRC 80197 / JCM 7670 / NBRC 15755 / NCIMB 13165 / 161) TaxID=240015 RepID=C1F8I1_ACIC5|nr:MULTISPECIES: base excision DNA repair protein, HhH-GPD family [Acidobacterium]ACO33678.1 base excision DNA repair protein, HhH-GPD family [Acidobacterium capsulatum ATCC 51196]HCT59245.1 base excision DNA repair protein [Acidobacterium sp.]
MTAASRLRTLYDTLAAAYGPQHWWPSESPLETMVGACLTQGTAWTSVERSLANLRARDLLQFDALLALPEDELRELIRPSGFMQRKAATLRALLELVANEYGGSLERFAEAPAETARAQLLAITGIGPETADAILLYALGQPAMVVDEYLRRVVVRHGLAPERVRYAEVQQLALAAFAEETDPAALADHCNEFHALVVQVGKAHCGRTPNCAQCPLRGDLEYYQQEQNRQGRLSDLRND